MKLAFRGLMIRASKVPYLSRQRSYDLSSGVRLDHVLHRGDNFQSVADDITVDAVLSRIGALEATYPSLSLDARDKSILRNEFANLKALPEDRLP